MLNVTKNLQLSLAMTEENFEGVRILYFGSFKAKVRRHLIVAYDILVQAKLNFYVIVWNIICHCYGCIRCWNAKNLPSTVSISPRSFAPSFFHASSISPFCLASSATPCAHLPNSFPSIFSSASAIAVGSALLVEYHREAPPPRGKQRMPRWWANEGWANLLMIQNENLAFLIPTGWLARRLWHLWCAKSLMLACSSHTGGGGGEFKMPHRRELVVLRSWPGPHLIVSLCAVELVITEGGGGNREQSTGRHTARQLSPCQFHCSDI